MTIEQMRSLVIAAYKEILGRNKYSQELRNYCYNPYKDGNYYSDCSSSISYAYRKAGFDFGILNTVGMFQSKKFTIVPVVIEKGQIKNPEILRLADLLLYAGSDSSRSYAQYVGHVEMVGEINGSAIYLYGHGSGTPKRTEMVSKNRSRYNSKTSTKLGNKGLIRVIRFLTDDSDIAPVKPTNIVAEMQKCLIACGYDCGPYGVDGELGKDTKLAVKKFQMSYNLKATGLLDDDTIKAIRDAYDSQRVINIVCTGDSVNVRVSPGTSYKIIGVAKKGEKFAYLRNVSPEGWFMINYKGAFGWISGKYSEIEDE